MRFIQLYILPAVLFLASCKDDGETGQRPDEFVSFSAEITAFATRASQEGHSWSDGDRIGAFMLAADMSRAADNSANIAYTAAENGRLVKFTSSSPLYMPKDGSSVAFLTYYPYNAEVGGDMIYPVRLADQRNGSSACDLMSATSDKQYQHDGGEESRVPLYFQHRLSKVILRFMDEYNRPVTMDEVVIGGMLTQGAFDLKATKFTADSDSEAEIPMYRNPITGFYEAIVLPAAIKSSQKASFTTGEKQGEWVFTDTDINLPEFRKGTRYTFTIRIIEGVVTGPAVVEIEGGNASFPWGDGNTTDGSAGQIVYEVYPLGDDAFADTELAIAFNGPVPAIGTKGFIRIYNADTKALVDEINMSERQVGIQDGVTLLNTWMDIVGVTPKASTTNRKRVVNYHPVRIEGSTVIIKPHQQRLKYDTRYYVTIDKTAIEQADFTGIYANRWIFTTRPQPDAKTTVKVSHTDENADFFSLQGAIDYFAANIDRGTPKTINIDNGIYKEIIYIRDQDNITVRGESRDGVNIRYDNRNELAGGVNEGMDISQFAPLGTPVNSGNRSMMTIGGNADKIRFENLTIENTSGNRGQAEAIIIRNDNGSTAFVDCTFLGYQDTVLSGGGYNWYYNCLIAGATDFIWGGCKVSLFEKCEIRAINNGRAMQARVASGNIGYVFLDSKFTVGPGITGKTDLIYSYAPDNYIFLNTTFSDVFINKLREDGITAQPAVPTVSEGMRMYNCTNEADASLYDQIPAEKITSIYRLSQSEYEQKFGSRSSIMNGYDGAGGVWFQ